MEAVLMRSGGALGSCSAAALPDRVMANGTPSSSCGAARGSLEQSIRSENRKTMVLMVLDRSKINERFLSNRAANMRIRAARESGSKVDEKVREIASDEAVEGPESTERNAGVKVEELKSEDGSAPEIPMVADLLLSTLKAEDESAETAVEKKDAVLDVASTSAVEDPKQFFQDVKGDAAKIAAEVGRNAEDVTVELVDIAEDLEDRQVAEAQLVKEGQFDESGAEGLTTRAEAESKIVETAKGGYEVLKFAAEGALSAGQNARQGLGDAKEAFDKRVKSFGIAADEVKEISSQVAQVTRKTLGEAHVSASTFQEELQVNIEDKKAASSLKPESEQSPLTKVTREVQENFNKATTGDGPLAQLNETLSENFSKASEAGRDFTTRVSERAAELTDQTKKDAEEVTSDVTSSSSEGDISIEYEDERGNEFLKGNISSKDETSSLKYDVDEPHAVPSKKQDETNIGPED